MAPTPPNRHAWGHACSPLSVVHDAGNNIVCEEIATRSDVEFVADECWTVVSVNAFHPDIAAREFHWTGLMSFLSYANKSWVCQRQLVMFGHSFQNI
ncbi:hypothetical protein AFLA_011395 [Aspergillus flavus NRRL3357]|nr:hypothetical protein AFLA_011395 [Aspergillus flavus NRRL3357]